MERHGFFPGSSTLVPRHFSSWDPGLSAVNTSSSKEGWRDTVSCEYRLPHAQGAHRHELISLQHEVCWWSGGCSTHLVQLFQQRSRACPTFALLTSHLTLLSIQPVSSWLQASWPSWCSTAVKRHHGHSSCYIVTTVGIMET